MIGHRIRQIRLARGLTQEELVKGYYDRSYISLIERGKIVPSEEAIRLLARRLGVDAEELSGSDKLTLAHACQLLDDGAAAHDADAVESAWGEFFRCDALKEMIDAVKKWASLTSNTHVLLALRATLKRAQEDMVDSRSIVELRILIGNCQFRMGSYREAAWTYQEILDDHPPIPFIPRVQINLGSTLMDLEEYEPAIKSFTLALKDSRDERETVRAHLGIGRCYRYLSCPSKAMEAFRVVKLQAQDKDQRLYNHALHAIAVLLLDERRFEEAQTLLARVHTFYKEYGMKHNEVELIEEYVRLDFYRGQYTSALQWCGCVSDMLPSIDTHLAGRFLMWKSRIHAKMGDDTSSRNADFAARVMLRDQYQRVVKHIDPLCDMELPLPDFSDGALSNS